MKVRLFLIFAFLLSGRSDLRAQVVFGGNGDVTKTFTPYHSDDVCWFTGIGTRNNGDVNTPQGATSWSTIRSFITGLNVRTVRDLIGFKGTWNGGTGSAPPVGLPMDQWNAPGVRIPSYNSTTQQSRTNELFNNHGISTVMSIGGMYDWGQTVTQRDFKDVAMLNDQLTSLKTEYVPGSIIGIEGPNEYGSAFPSQVWQSLREYTTLIRQRRDFYDIRLGTGRMPLYMTPLWTRAGYISDSTNLGSVANDVTFGTLHFYPNKKNATTTSWNCCGFNWEQSLDEAIGIVRSKNVGLDKQVVVTETGFSTDQGNENSQAKYLGRIIGENMLQGNIARTILFTLTDETASNVAHKYGLINVTGNAVAPHNFQGYTPKKGYDAVRNLLGMLKTATWSRSSKRWTRPALTRQNLTLSISNANPTTKYILTQKSEKQYFLLIWQNVSSFTSSGVDTTPPGDDVTIEVQRAGAKPQLRLYGPAGGVWSYGTPRPMTVDTSGTFAKCTLNVPDFVMAVRITFP